MTNDNASLLERAESIAAKAHVPYSRFRVGAIAVLADGSIHAGCNVENAAYGASVCAEVNAITTAVANGDRCGCVSRRSALHALWQLSPGDA